VFVVAAEASVAVVFDEIYLDLHVVLQHLELEFDAVARERVQLTQHHAHRRLLPQQLTRGLLG